MWENNWRYHKKTVGNLFGCIGGERWRGAERSDEIEKARSQASTTAWMIGPFTGKPEKGRRRKSVLDILRIPRILRLPLRRQVSSPWGRDQLATGWQLYKWVWHLGESLGMCQHYFLNMFYLLTHSGFLPKMIDPAGPAQNATKF